jgi:predicted transcriptional regulator of viral defense system
MQRKASYKIGKLDEFVEETPVFTIRDLERVLQVDSGKNVQAREAAYNFVKNRRRAGRLGVVKEGVYYVVRPGANPMTMPVDEFLVASKLAPDSVLAFHTALDVLGFGHSMFSSYYYFSKIYRRPVRFRKIVFRCVVFPEALRNEKKENFGNEKVERLGQKIVTTGKERTLVESLERPEYCGGFEEMYRSLEKMPYLQFDVLLKYLELRKRKKLYAIVGFFLEQHREDFNVDESLLHELERSKPSTPVYWDRSKKGGSLINRWNLIVPAPVVERNWEEF